MVQLLTARTVLAVRDLAASTHFYTDVLGFTRDFGDSSDGWSFLSRGGFRVMLGGCPTALPASELGDHSYVAYVLVDDVDQLYDEFVTRGAPVTSAPTSQPWGLREFGLRTLDGHRLQFGQPLAPDS